MLVILICITVLTASGSLATEPLWQLNKNIGDSNAGWMLPNSEA